MYEVPREDQTHCSVVHDMQDKLVKKTKNGLDLEQGQIYEAPSEDQSHYSVIINMPVL